MSVTTNAGDGGPISVTATRGDVSASDLSSSASMTINRPSPSGNVSLTGDNLICSGGTKTYTLNNVPQSAGGITWEVPSTLSRSGSGNSISVSYASNGNGYVKATFNNCGQDIPLKNNVYAGPPNLQAMTFGTTGGGQSSVSTFNRISASTWYNVRSNQPSDVLSNARSWSPNTSINAFTSGTNNVDYNLNLSSGQSVTVTVSSATNGCSTGNARNVSFTTNSGFRVALNPAKDKVTVTFDHTDYLEALPEQLELVSENTTKAVRSVTVKDVFQAKMFKGGNAVEFDIRDLSRGVYYLRVTDSRRSEEEQIEMIRLVFE